jgi:hypothetical protein
VCVNEQDKMEIDMMVLTCIANIVFAPKYGFYIEETDIALGIYTGEKDKMLKEAAKYIKERSKIEFLELNSWDLDSLRIILKKYKLRGINHFIIDTLKILRGIGNQGMLEYQMFCHTVEQLKKMVGSTKKGRNKCKFMVYFTNDRSKSCNKNNGFQRNRNGETNQTYFRCFNYE